MSTHYFIRHGEATHNLQPERIGGHSNSAPLTPAGEWQAALFGETLRNRRFSADAAYYSGAVRTEQTGRIALAWAGLDLPLERDDRLQEIHMGRWEGHDRAAVYTPEMVRYLDARGLDGALPTAETMRQVQARMWESLITEHQRMPDGKFLVFGHGLAIRSLAGKIKNQTKAEILNETTPNLSITRIDVGLQGSASVQYVGERYIR